jgi:hypothetical protein
MYSGESEAEAQVPKLGWYGPTVRSISATQKAPLYARLSLVGRDGFASDSVPEAKPRTPRTVSAGPRQRKKPRSTRGFLWWAGTDSQAIAFRRRSRGHPVQFPQDLDNAKSPALREAFFGGQGRIRTAVQLPEQIYSLPPLTTRPPTQCAYITDQFHTCQPLLRQNSNPIRKDQKPAQPRQP